MSGHMRPVEPDEPRMLGDHPALDILNTVGRVKGELVDSLQSDRDVLRWLTRAGWPVEDGLAHLGKPSLLENARALRETIRTLIEKRKAGKRVNPGALNIFLAEARSHLELVSKRDGSLHLRRRWDPRTSEQVLVPLAECAAELLASGDLSLVRRCENEECVLWFYDRTRSHHRRWCDMAKCGNRHKVAAFRERRQRRGSPGTIS
jgi:predicted RNA-binding Zn ribbon-like protein